MESNLQTLGVRLTSDELKQLDILFNQDNLFSE
ncbi:hypothetical protein [Paenibacillus polymyxa]